MFTGRNAIHPGIFRWVFFFSLISIPSSFIMVVTLQNIQSTEGRRAKYLHDDIERQSSSPGSGTG